VLKRIKKEKKNQQKMSKKYTIVLLDSKKDICIDVASVSGQENKYAIVIKNVKDYPVEVADALLSLASKPDGLNKICGKLQKIFRKKICDII